MISRAMKEFSKFIDNHSFIVFPLTGARFMCSRSKESSSRSRLDKFLLSIAWEEITRNVVWNSLPRLTSNHLPIMLDGRRNMITRVRVENMWLGNRFWG